MKQRIGTFEDFINEQELLLEMPNVYYWDELGEKLKISTNIWLDDKKLYMSSGHGKRIKAQKDKHLQMPKNKNKLISISTSDYRIYKGSDEIDINKLPKDFEVDKDDIQKVIAFMKKYKIAIDLLMDKEINFKDDFKDIVLNDKVIKKYDGKPMIGDVYQHTEKTQIKIISVSDSKVVAKELKEDGENLYFLHRKDLDKYIKEGTKSSDLGILVSKGDYTLSKSKEYVICSK